MGRKPCCEKVGLKRGPWTAEEDQKLVSFITSNGICCWRALPKLAGLLRCGKSCRLRWTNYLRPDLKRGIFTEAEEDLILDLHAILGNRWSRIAAQLPGRTDNEIKNYWNTRLKKRLSSQGLDPATHLPLDSSKHEEDSDSPDGEDGDSSDASGSKAVKKAKEPAKPVRQPRGPKPAPQLKMCQSDAGLLLLKVPKVVVVPKLSSPNPGSKCDDDSDLSPCPSSCSTVTTKSGPEDHHESTLARKLTSAPSYPEAELWKCIKPSTPSSLLSTTAMLDAWDSCSDSPLNSQANTMVPKAGESMHCSTAQVMVDNAGMQPVVDMTSSAFTSQPAAQDFGGTCFAQPEMGMSWSMDVEPSPESLFAPNSMSLTCVGFYSREPAPRPSQDLQKLAALLDLI